MEYRCDDFCVKLMQKYYKKVIHDEKGRKDYQVLYHNYEI